MVNKNNNINLIPKENYKQVEEVREINNEIPSFEEFMKTYEGDVNYADLSGGDIRDSEGYGPCKNSLCGCSCSSRTCKCWKDSARNEGSGSSFEVHGRKPEKEKEKFKNWEEEYAWNVLKARDKELSGQISASALGYRDSDGEFKFLSGTAGGGISRNGIKGKLSADLYNVKSDGVQVRIGVGVDTGVSFEDGLEVKAIGFGLTLGNQFGISTPLGEVKIDTEDCVIQ